MPPHESEPDLAAPESVPVDVTLPLNVRGHPRFEKPLPSGSREVRLLNDRPWVRTVGKLGMEVSTEGWRFPAPLAGGDAGIAKPRLFRPDADVPEEEAPAREKSQTRLKPPADTVP